jgi:hypothetical protein
MRYAVLYSTTLLAYSLPAQEVREVITPPRQWSSPFPEALTLGHRGDAYGKGNHRIFVGQIPPVDVITSSLSEDGVVWEVSTKDGYFVDFYRSPGLGGERELVFTSSILTRNETALILVDVFIQDQKISFLVADMDHYFCFDVRRKPLPPTQQGAFALLPFSTNSANWYLNRIVHLQSLGYDYSSGQHGKFVKSIELTGHNSVKVEAVGAGLPHEIYDFSSGVPIKNGLAVQEVLTPAEFPSEPWSEAKVVKYFSLPSGDELKWRVLNIEGGKSRVFEVLDQLQDQQAVADIKQKIIASLD